MLMKLGTPAEAQCLEDTNNTPISAALKQGLLTYWERNNSHEKENEDISARSILSILISVNEQNESVFSTVVHTISAKI